MAWPVGSEEWKEHQEDGMYKGTRQNRKVRCSHSWSRAKYKDAELQEKKKNNQI